jgi:uncharacterized protein YkwD
MIQARQTLIAASIAVMLAACGGGGGGSSGTGTPAPPATDVNAQVTTAPAPSYAAASGNVAVYGAVNTLRGKIGSGQLTQNGALDAAALAHWNYINTDDGALLKSHAETAGLTGFTGVDPTARALAAGYHGAVAESMFGQNLVADSWGTCSAAWANSVYHVAVLFTGARDVGLAAGTTKTYPAYGKYTVCVVETGLASTAAEQLPPEGTVRVYPYAGQVDVPVVFQNHNETPTPLPEFAELGAPISLNFKAKPASTAAPVISISQLSVTPAGGAALDARILVNHISSTGPTLTSDSNQDVYTATLVPTARLTPATAYAVSFSGLVNGKAVSKTWSFITAAN